MEPGDRPLQVTLIKPRLVRGFITVFDVLGFKSFCANNTDQKIAEEILSYIDFVPEGMPEVLAHSLSMGKPKAYEHAKALLAHIKWLVFSDTMVVVLPDAEKVEKKVLQQYVAACALLNRTMFERGLPLRGAMLLGEFVIANRCVAGKVVVDALHQAHMVEAACTMVSNDVWVLIQDRFGSEDIMDVLLRGLLPRCPVPCKDGVKTLTTLNWLNISMGKSEDPKDTYKLVMDQFLAHGKQLDAAAYTKARNTADIMNAWLAPRIKKPAATANS
jgi:hypothetical protein